MAQMKTPGVYLIEKDAFPNSVVEVATAVPAFIGYTAKADNGGKSLLGKPFRISSFSEFLQYFGNAPEYKFGFSLISPPAPAAPADDAGKAVDPNGDGTTGTKKKTTTEETTTPTAENLTPPTVAPIRKADIVINGNNYTLVRNNINFRLFQAIKFFYQNGGGPCYIVSVGDYTSTPDMETLSNVLPMLEKEMEPTMVLAPDALSLDSGNCYTLYQSILAHCNKMKSRIGIFDVYDGNKDLHEAVGDEKNVVDAFRTGIGANFLKYGAAYYPWVNTGIVQDTEISFMNLTDDSLVPLRDVLLLELLGEKPTAAAPTVPTAEGEEVKTAETEDKTNTAKKTETATPPPAAPDLTKIPDKETLRKDNIRKYVNYLPTYTADYIKKKNTAGSTEFNDKNPKPEELNKTFIMLSSAYNAILKEIQAKLNLMPPASAMAGIYTMVDNNRGVWKAPANVSLNATISPSVNISFEDQEDLNVPLNGKAINAIRTFVGEGVMVWGARTLDGNSQDWKYINVRRTMIMLEQSVLAAAKAYVFEPNDANTWTTVKSMIDNFLYQQWKKGALVGAKPEEAYAVMVGLGNTMTGNDILEGIMRVTVLVALSRPAEFIEITFQQQMQKS